MRHALAALAIAIVAPLTASQTPAHGTSQGAPPPDGSSVTATGCLARGEAAKTFVLKNVTWQSTNVPSAQASGHAHGTPAPAGAPAANTAPGETLRLDGAASTLKLDAHVGHTISATGTIAKRDPVVTPGIVLPDPQPQGDTTSRTRDAEVKASASQRTLTMRSMAHVAGECK
jgi:hypothetical protein